MDSKAHLGLCVRPRLIEHQGVVLMKSFSALKIGISFFVILLSSLSASGNPVCSNAETGYLGLQKLSRLSKKDLNRLFAAGVVSHIPHGHGHGRSLVVPAANWINDAGDFFWQGKDIDAQTGSVINRFLGQPIATATVRIDTLMNIVDRELSYLVDLYSLFHRTRYPEDNLPAIIIDYQFSDVPLMRDVRDQIRQVLADEFQELYLGRMTYVNAPDRIPRVTNLFALQFPCQ